MLAAPRLACRATGRAADRREGPWAPRPRVMAHPVAVLILTLAFRSSPRRSSRSGSTPRRHDPPAVGAAAGLGGPLLAREFGAGEFAPISLAIAAGVADDPGQHRRPVRLFATDRGGPTGGPGRGPRRCRSAPEPIAVPAPLRGPGRSPGPVRPGDARGNDDRRPHRVHGLHAGRTECARGPGARPRPPRLDRSACGSGGDDRPRRRRRGRRPGRRRGGGGGVPPDVALHHRDDVSRALRPPPLGGPAGQGDRHERPVDRGELRGPRLDLPAGQPVRPARVPAPRVRSRRPSR